MRYLFFTNTPAHVHLFKHPVRRLSAAGHEVLVLGREYTCTTDLLSYYDLPYRVYGSVGLSQGALVRELPRHFVSIFREARRFDPDLVFGMGAYASLTGGVLRTPSVLVVDSEPDGVDHAISQRLVEAMLTPHAFEKDLGPKQYRFRGFKECAYLHPDVFDPDPSVREALGVGPDERFVIVRLNAFASHHDVGASGFGPGRRERLVDALAEHATVLISDERGDADLDGLDARPFDVHPGRMHDALSEASLLVADTQTMVTEAALLGTPAVRSNSFVGDDDMGNFQLLAEHGLVYNEASVDDAIDRAVETLADPTAARRHRERRDEYLSNLVNLTDVIVDVAERGGSVEGVAGLGREPEPAIATR